MRESLLQKKVKQAITERYGKNVWYYHPMDRTQRGILDVILCLNGIFIVGEIKSDMKKYGVTKLQQYNIDKISAAGGFAIVCETVEDFMSGIEFINRKFTLTRRNR